MKLKNGRTNIAISQSYRDKPFELPFNLQASNLKGGKKALKVDVMRFVVSYSQKYADRAREERQRVIEKAARIADSGQFFGSNDARKYIKSTPFPRRMGSKSMLNTFMSWTGIRLQETKCSTATMPS